MNTFKASAPYKITKKLLFSLIFQIYQNRKQKDFKYYFSKWVKEDGEDNLLINYPLNKNSLIVDVGGYKGHFSDKIISLYDPKIIIFEPVREFNKILKNRYKNNSKVSIRNYGLSDKSSFQDIFISGDGTSLIKKSDKISKIKTQDVADFVKKHKFIDLMSINIEGAEYQLLNRLIETNLLKNIKFLQVQFHDFVPNSKALRKDTLKNILKTHKVRYSYPFVWESFEIRSNNITKCHK
jgi:FkbM family methyltransferase